MPTDKKGSELPVFTEVDLVDRLVSLNYTTGTPVLSTITTANHIDSPVIMDKIRGTAPTSIPIILSDQTAPPVVGIVWTGYLPYGMDITKLKLTSRTPSTSGKPTVQITANGVNMLSTAITIDANERTSATAAVAYVLAIDEIADDALLEVSVTGTGTGATGLKLWIVGKRNDAATTDPPVVSTVRTQEGFDTASVDQVATAATTTATSATGAGSLTHSDQFNATGGYSLHVNGTDQHYLTWDWPTSTNRKGKWYYRHAGLPSETAYFLQWMAADGTTVNAQVGMDATGHFVLTNSAAGTTDTANFVCVSGNKYKLALSSTGGGSGSHVLNIWGGAVINDDTAGNDTDTLTVATTATSFSDERFGLCNTLAGSGTIIPANLTDEGFNGTNGAQVTNANTSATAHSGTGGIRFSTAWALEGTSSLEVFSNANDSCRFENASHQTHYSSFYFRPTLAPIGSAQYFVQTKDSPGSGSVWGYQMGLDTDLTLKTRKANSGSAAGDVMVTSPLSLNTDYRIDIKGVALGTLEMWYYTGANLHSTNTANAVQHLTMTNPLLVANFGADFIGQIGGSSTSGAFKIDRFKSSNAGMPSPIGATGGSNFECFLDRYWTDTTNMPAGTNVPVDDDGGGPSTVSNLLVPSTGCWFGATTPSLSATPSTKSTGSDPTGLAQWVAIAGRRPDIMHFYKASSVWNGQATTQELAMAEPSTGARAIILFAWNFEMGSTMAQAASGSQNSAWINTFNGFKSYNHKFFLSLHHEWDAETKRGSAGNTDADYIAAFRAFVTLMRSQNVTNCVVCWTQTGAANHAGANGSGWEGMYPGDAYVDWITYDPYWQDFSGKPDFAALMNNDYANNAGYTGVYDWAVANHPTKPIMLSEWGTWFNTETVAECTTQIASIDNQAPDFANLKAIVHYNTRGANDNQIQRPSSQGVVDRTPAANAFAVVAAVPYFNVGTENAP